jgi:hypothetical protein
MTTTITKPRPELLNIRSSNSNGRVALTKKHSVISRPGMIMLDLKDGGGLTLYLYENAVSIDLDVRGLKRGSRTADALQTFLAYVGIEAEVHLTNDWFSVHIMTDRGRSYYEAATSRIVLKLFADTEEARALQVAWLDEHHPIS